MIPHTTLLDTHKPIYSVDRAEILLDMGIYNHRQLSIMKQQNVRYALEHPKKYHLSDIQEVMDSCCGYCIKYTKGVIGCSPCPLCKKLKYKCYEYRNYDFMLTGNSRKKVKQYHKEFCKLLGFKEVYGGK